MYVRLALISFMAGAFAGCGGTNTPAGAFAPIDTDHAVFWDRQTTETAALMEAIVTRFNDGGPPVPVAIETTGNYGEIFQKVMAGIQARRLPAMAVSYESMTSQYAAAGAVVALDDYFTELDDFFPAVLESNRYSEFDGALLSFPFAKSVLMLYANHRVLAAAGIDAPPATWEDFLAQCRTIREKTGKPAYAIAVDCSTISGMIFSMGGEVVKAGVPQYDQPASIRVFELLETLIREDLAYQISARTFDDEVAFAGDQVAFTLRTSAGSANMAVAMGGKNADWSINRIPQADPGAPATVLFGPNITLFKTGPAQEAAAREFTAYFTSPPVMKTWALATGYLPFRKSLASDPDIQAYWEAWPSNRAPFDSLAIARTEPNLANWQQVRKLVEQAETSVLAGLKTGREAALTLQREANALLAH